VPQGRPGFTPHLLTVLVPCGRFARARRPCEGTTAMYGPLFAAAAILLGIAGIVLYLSDVSISRAERAARSFDRTYVRNRAARRRR
jgi:hypothetical protein